MHAVHTRPTTDLPDEDRAMRWETPPPMPVYDEGTGNPAPQPFDPTHLANLARAQWPEWPAVADALLRCTTQWQFDPYYFDLYDPAARDARCGHRATVILECPDRGPIKVEVMANGCIGGIVYLERSAQMEPWNDAPAEATVWGPEELLIVVHRRADHKA